MREMSIMQQEIRRCEVAIEHLDATLRLVDPEFDFSSLKPMKSCVEDDYFRPGETPLMALDIMREAGVPMSTTDISKAMLVKKGSPRVTFRQFERLNQKVNGALNTKFRQGVVRKKGRVEGSNRAVIWELLG